MKVFVKGVNACVQRKMELELYKRYLRANNHELVDSPEKSDRILLWTCGFRRDVRENSLRTIEKYKQIGPELIVCGCLPSIDPDAVSAIFKGTVFPWKKQWEAMPVLFGDAKPDLHDFKPPAIERSIGYDLDQFRKDHPGVRVTYTDQFVKLYVSEGCNFDCAYCAEKLAFPPYRSIAVEELVEGYKGMAREVEQAGGTMPNFNKIVLWADSLGHYGSDINADLPQLIDALISIDNNIQVGLEHLHPLHFLEYFDELMEYIKKRKIFLFSIPIQSASDRILKLMNRLYTSSDVEKIFSMLNENNFTDIETDIIAGFPSETDAEFEKTLDFILRHKIKYTKISGYMETKGMDSAALEGKVPAEVMAGRCQKAKEAIQDAGLLCNYDADPKYQEGITRGFVELFSAT